MYLKIVFPSRLKNGKPIDQTPKLRVLKKDGFGIITIEKATTADSGIYRCCASNSHNAIETQANVTIYEVEEVSVKPTFTRITGEFLQIINNLNEVFNFIHFS